jgi:Zn finger protein HypA/HybF involved in hydrogenase expression
MCHNAKRVLQLKIEIGTGTTSMNQSELSKTSTIEKEDARMCEDAKKTEEEEETSWCPLFMEGLPTDFASNPQLAAIASLLEEDDDNDDDKEGKQHESRDTNTRKQPSVVGTVGGGKARRTRRRNQSTPYPATATATATNSKKKASLGEAQLFLNMWKI